MRPGTRALLRVFLLLTLLAVVQLFVLADVADRFWAWTIHTEPTAAFLGAAYGAGAVLSALALRRDRWDEIRVPVLTVAVFATLTCVATLLHTHRLHLLDGGRVAQVAAWGWLAVYLVVPALCLAVVMNQQVRAPDAGRDRRPAVAHPIPPALAGLIAVEGVLLLAAGVVLFAGGLTVHHHVETVTSFWPWEITPLSSQVIGAWLLALGVAAALVLRERDLARLSVAAVTYTVFGVLQLVVVAWHLPQMATGDPWLWVHVAVLVAVAGTGAWGVRASRPGRLRGDAGSSPERAAAG